MDQVDRESRSDERAEKLREGCDASLSAPELRRVWQARGRERSIRNSETHGQSEASSVATLRAGLTDREAGEAGETDQISRLEDPARAPARQQKTRESAETEEEEWRRVASVSAEWRVRADTPNDDRLRFKRG